MAKTALPIAETAGGASSRRCRRAASHPIDWRQLSHELRTPLNAILGNVELLLDGSAGPLSAQARTCMGEVQAAGRQLLREIRLLLAWSELNASATKLSHHQAVDLIALIRAACLRERCHAARIDPADACLLIEGDPLWLQMLVAETLALPGAGEAAPVVRLERHSGGSTLHFLWSGFCAERAGTLRMALIAEIARLQRAVAAPHPDGLSLRWPREQLERAELERAAVQRMRQVAAPTIPNDRGP